MLFLKQFAGIFLISIILSCKNSNNHTIILNSNHTLSEKLVAPAGCYRVIIEATGILQCESKLSILNDTTRTNFSDHLSFNGKYENKEIYNADWYGGPIRLQLSPDSCIVNDFQLNVTFFD